MGFSLPQKIRLALTKKELSDFHFCLGLGEPPGTGTVGGPGSRTLNHAQLENQISISLINIIRLIVFLGQPPGTVSGPGSRTMHHAQLEN